MESTKNLVYAYSPIPKLREDQNYEYIEKAILSVFKEQKVSFLQVKEIFDSIEARLKNKLYDTQIGFID